MLTLVFVCDTAEQVQPNKPQKDLPKDAGDHTIQRLDMMRNSKGNLHTAEIRRNMQRIMQVVHRAVGCSTMYYVHGHASNEQSGLLQHGQSDLVLGMQFVAFSLVGSGTQ